MSRVGPALSQGRAFFCARAADGSAMRMTRFYAPVAVSARVIIMGPGGAVPRVSAPMDLAMRQEALRRRRRSSK